IVAAPSEAGKFDIWDPANISPLVAWLATEGCPASGKVFFVQGGRVAVFQPWTMAEEIDKNDRWGVAELDAEMAKLVAN
ncbi:MAG TPA: short-chain dehydrogenase, partial [Acidimicrobiales bacterium]|nr:short-chain dehydrogenase [Acidimicrobiales bacterium]